MTKPTVPATELPLTYRISTLSFPLQMQCVFINSKGIIFCIRERQLRSGDENGEIRYVSGSSVAGTSASSPGVPRHIMFIVHMADILFM